MADIDSIGQTAGLVWKYLKGNGASSLAALERGVDASKPAVHMAVGWLAREGKVEMREEKRVVLIALSGS